METTLHCGRLTLKMSTGGARQKRVLTRTRTTALMFKNRKYCSRSRRVAPPSPATGAAAWTAPRSTCRSQLAAVARTMAASRTPTSWGLRSTTKIWITSSCRATTTKTTLRWTWLARSCSLRVELVQPRYLLSSTWAKFLLCKTRVVQIQASSAARSL